MQSCPLWHHCNVSVWVGPGPATCLLSSSISIFLEISSEKIEVYWSFLEENSNIKEMKSNLWLMSYDLHVVDDWFIQCRSLIRYSLCDRHLQYFPVCQYILNCLLKYFDYIFTSKFLLQNHWNGNCPNYAHDISNLTWSLWLGIINPQYYII